MLSRVLWCICGSSVFIPLATLGCSTTSHLPKAQVGVPENWSKTAGAENGKRVAFSGQQQPTEWWKAFNDPVLDTLVEGALAGCTDLKAAEARVREARAQHSVAVSDFFPHTSIGGTAQRTRSSKAELNAMGPAAIFIPSKQNLFQAGFDTSWEIDLFGATREAERAANARTAARLAEYSGVRISVAAETARNYFELRGAQTLQAVLSDMVRSQKETVDLLERRRAAGTIADVEVTLSRGRVESTSAQIPSAEVGIQHAVTSLAVLLALSPDSVRELVGENQGTADSSISIVVGVPAEVLRARPDVRRAEHDVEAAAAAVGISTAELFPRLDLLGRGGTSGLEISDLGSWANRYWTMGPTLRWPILDIGRVLGNIRAQRARHEQALHAYEKVVLTALKDVEDSVVGYGEAQKGRERLAQAVEQYDASMKMAQDQYKTGTKEYLYVLESERQLLGAREAKAAGDTAVATAAVSLCKALGGCWPEMPASCQNTNDGHGDGDKEGNASQSAAKRGVSSTSEGKQP